MRISPLVIGPIPETKYSAGFIANMMADKFSPVGGHRLVTLQPISEVKHQNGIMLNLKDDIVKLRDDENSKVAPLARHFDWILTGIGARGKGQNLQHVNAVYGRQGDGRQPDGIIGDICSRLFDSNGNELAQTMKVSDGFVGISFRALEHMCRIHGRGKRVVAIAGGMAKYKAILTLLQRPQLLFNVLVTDELTARRLLLDLPTV
ncbi:MAG: hypothetical protein ACI9HK_003895 [Pirellulaceae bacterium]|jgi:hypothetical protein